MQLSSLQYLPLKLPLYPWALSFQQLPNQQSQQVRLNPENEPLHLSGKTGLACCFLTWQDIIGRCLWKLKAGFMHFSKCSILWRKSWRILRGKLLSLYLPALQMWVLLFAGATRISTAEAGRQKASRLTAGDEVGKAAAFPDRAPPKTGEVVSSQSLNARLLCVSRAKTLTTSGWNFNWGKCSCPV